MDIFRWLQQRPIFSSLSRRDLQRIAQIARTRTYERGDIIAREGDNTEGCFIISSGKVELVTDVDSPHPLVLGALGPGDFFGEMAIIDHDPRSATVRAIEPTECVEITRQAFMSEVRNRPDLAVKMLPAVVRRLSDYRGPRRRFMDIEALLERTPIFSSLSRRDLQRIGQVARTRTYEPGDIIAREGDNTEGCFVISSGKVEVVTDSDSPTRLVRATLEPGQCFGEIAILDERANSATVRAIEATECLEISRSAFASEIRNHPEIAVKMLPAAVRRLRGVRGPGRRDTSFYC